MFSINSGQIKIPVGSEQFRVMPEGNIFFNDGRDGDRPWFADTAMLAANLNKRADYVLIDYNHNSETVNHTLPPAAGWIKAFEAREDGLWAVDVEWTEAALAMIERKEALYISPAFILNSETKEVMSIESVALVNNPGIRGLTRLASILKPTENIIMNEEIKTSDEEAVTVEEAVSVEEVDAPVEELETVEGESAEMPKGVKDLLEDIFTSIAELQKSNASMELAFRQHLESAVQLGVTPAATDMDMTTQQTVELCSVKADGGLTPEQKELCRKFSLSEAEFLSARK